MRRALFVLFAVFAASGLQAAFLDWDNVTYPSGSLNESFTVDDGDLEITISGTTGGFDGGSPVVNGDQTAPSGTDSLFLNTNYASTVGSGPPASITFTLDYTAPEGVTDLQFTVFDVDSGPDQWIDRITVTATNAQGTTLNPSVIATSSSNQVDPTQPANRVIGTAGADAGQTAGNATFTFNQDNITQIVIVYENLGADRGNQWVAISDVFWNEMGFLDNSTKTATPASSSPPDIAPSETITYQINVINDGDTDVTNIQVTDNIPANTNSFTVTGIPSGATNDSTGAGTGVNGTGFLDINSFTVPANSTRAITFTTVVDNDISEGTSISNSVPVTGANNISEIIVGNTLTVPTADLSTSSKTVDSGTVAPGDMVEYTITVTNSSSNATATNVRVIDDIPANISGWNLISSPSGSTNDSTLGGGAFGNGFLDINGFNVAPSSSVTIVFEATVDGSTPSGTTINNSADIEVGSGPPTVVNAPPVLVVLGGGTGQLKQLYMDNSSGNILSRTPSTTSGSNGLSSGSSVTYTMTPAFQADAILASGNIPIRVAVSGPGLGSITATLRAGGTVIGSQNQFAAIGGGVEYRTFNVNLASPLALSAGSTIELTITNEGSFGGYQIFSRNPSNTAQDTRVDLNVITVINVDSVEAYNAAFSGGTVPVAFNAGDDVFVRAVVSDPFGSYDINAAAPGTLPTVTITAPDNSVVVNAVAMTEVDDSGGDASGATKTFEYVFSTSGGLSGGEYDISVTAVEGTENSIFDTGTGSFLLATPPPSFTVVKLVRVDDGTVTENDDFYLPDTEIRYQVTVTNSGTGSPDSGSFVFTDDLPPEVELFVGDFVGGNGGPVDFDPGASTLTYTFSGLGNGGDSIVFKNSSGNEITPSAAANDGFDDAVRSFEITPSGTFAPWSGSGAQPSIIIEYRVRLK